MPIVQADRFARSHQLLNLSEPSPALAQSEAWGVVCGALYGAIGRHRVDPLQAPEDAFLALQRSLKVPLKVDVAGLFGLLLRGATAAYRQEHGPIKFDDAKSYLGRAETFVHVMDNL